MTHILRATGPRPPATDAPRPGRYRCYGSGNLGGGRFDRHRTPLRIPPGRGSGSRPLWLCTAWCCFHICREKRSVELRETIGDSVCTSAPTAATWTIKLGAPAGVTSARLHLELDKHKHVTPSAQPANPYQMPVVVEMFQASWCYSKRLETWTENEYQQEWLQWICHCICVFTCFYDSQVTVMKCFSWVLFTGWTYLGLLEIERVRREEWEKEASLSSRFSCVRLQLVECFRKDLLTRECHGVPGRAETLLTSHLRPSHTWTQHVFWHEITKLMKIDMKRTGLVLCLTYHLPIRTDSECECSHIIVAKSSYKSAGVMLLLERPQL